MVICELNKISKSYDSKKIIDSLSLDINASEMLAITGQSGSGKSTILNMIGLLEKPDTGIIRLFEQPIPRINSKKINLLLRYKLAYLF